MNLLMKTIILKYTFLGVRIDKDKDQIVENTAENSNK